MQIPIYVINNMPEPGRNLAADACMGRTQLSPCIYNFSTRTIRASRNAMPAWYFFHAEPLISRFSLEKYITLLQQLWQTVLMWNLYPIFISLNQLAVKITPAESFLWMHLHQFQYLSLDNIGDSKLTAKLGRDDTFLPQYDTYRDTPARATIRYVLRYKFGMKKKKKKKGSFEKGWYICKWLPLLIKWAISTCNVCSGRNWSQWHCNWKFHQLTQVTVLPRKHWAACKIFQSLVPAFWQFNYVVTYAWIPGIRSTISHKTNTQYMKLETGSTV